MSSEDLRSQLGLLLTSRPDSLSPSPIVESLVLWSLVTAIIGIMVTSFIPLLPKMPSTVGSLVFLFSYLFGLFLLVYFAVKLICDYLYRRRFLVGLTASTAMVFSHSNRRSGSILADSTLYAIAADHGIVLDLPRLRRIKLLLITSGF
jgi:hypothetical protein